MVMSGSAATAMRAISGVIEPLRLGA
jgi:hypothetical protein